MSSAFNTRRALHVARRELVSFLRRPLFVTWVLFLGWNALLISRGRWFYRSVDTSVGTTVSWVNSEFQIAFVLALMGFLILGFFIALACGTTAIADRAHRVDELLHSTPLTTTEYVWGKFLGALAGVVSVIAVMMLAVIVFTHVLPNPETPEAYGPLNLRAYLMPALVFLVPAAVFLGGAAFTLGMVTNRVILVFLLPISAVLFYNQFFWGWVPPDMAPRWVTFWQMIDPSGFRWLKQTWLMADRGIAFYNANPIGYDGAFLLSRVGHVVFGFVLVAWSRRSLDQSLRRPGNTRLARLARRVNSLRSSGAMKRIGGTTPSAVPGTAGSLRALDMRQRPRGWWTKTWSVTRAELKELISQPGLYIFVPAVFIFTVVLLDAGAGPFRTPLLVTSGYAATFGLQAATFWMCLLVLFYAVESFRREWSTRVADIFYVSPVPTSAILAGKVLANLVVALAILAATFLAAVWLIKNSGTPLSLGPFAVVWGLLYVPTYLLWIAFVSAVFALTRNRWATYGVAAAAISATAWLMLEGDMTWLTNWPLMGAVSWSDMGPLELDRRALILNRLLALASAAFLALIAVAGFRRRDRDPATAGLGRRWLRLPKRLRAATALAAVAVVVLAFSLWREVHTGFEGNHARRLAQDYWRTNMATWLDAPLPEISHVELTLDLDPEHRQLRAEGWYDLINRQDHELAWIPMSTGRFWENLSWTLDGRSTEPEPFDGLYVFTPEQPLARGATARVGFRYSATLPQGSSRNGGWLALGEFLLPSGVVATGRNPEFVPVVGYVPTVGIDDDNRYEPARQPPGFHLGITEGSTDRSPFTHRLTITAPSEYTINATGSLVAERDAGEGRKTVVWETSYPLRVFNLIGGRYAVKRGDRTAVFYHPDHNYNVDTMLEALDGALRYYGEWFHPYVWNELRLSEFPAVALYARGNPTNIFFSEGIGFLTGSSPRVDQAFMITAHEAAHQWWGHIVSHGNGPGGIVLAEGAAHFATMMLIEQMRGPLQRMSFARGIENFYGEFRQPTGEKPLAETYIDRPGGATVVYDKGGWVFWMLMKHMGREAFLAGVQDFFRQYHHNPDHPVLQDFVGVLRGYAQDTDAYDAFVQQWFFERIMPEYQLLAVEKNGAEDAWTVDVRLVNVGSGRMPVVVAATSGRRFGRDGKQLPEFRECRDAVTLGANEEAAITLRCDFEPDRIVVDPDVDVFQLQRQAAQARL